VLLWIVYERPYSKEDLLESWGHVNATIAAASKQSLIVDEGRFAQLLEGFRSDVGRDMKTVVQRCRYVLWPHLQYGPASLIQHDEMDKHRDNIYDEFVAAFQWGVDQLQNKDK
jgi:hypothetical protein